MAIRAVLLLAVAGMIACTDAAGPVVAIPASAPPQEQYAATVLSQHLGVMCNGGTAVPIQAPDKTTANQMLVGATAALAAGVPAARLAGLGNESFVLSTSAAPALPPGAVVASGGVGATRGTLYAVSGLLRRLGVRFFAANATQYPSGGCPVPVAALDETVKPAFTMRDSNEYATTSHVDWAILQHDNKVAATAAQGGGVVYASPPGFVHTSYALLGTSGRTPPPELFKAHPEWFWPHNDSSVYGQLCWTNASLVAYIIPQVKAFLRSQPSANIISVSQNDNQNYCRDPGEMAVINAEGSPIGPLLRAVNTIAAAIADEFPHVSVDTLAYQYTRPAPKITKPRANVIVRLCSIECDFSKPLDASTNAPFATDLANWSRIASAAGLYIWDYVTNFGNFVMPFPNWEVLAANARIFQQNNVRGVFEEGAYCGPGGDMTELKAFVMSEALWTPTTANGTALIADFVAFYYGPAAPHVATYLSTMLESVQATNYYMHENFDWHAPFLTPAAMLTSASAFAAARQAATGVYVDRVDRSKLAVYYVLLLRWDEMQSYATAHKLAWPIESTKQAAYNEFARVYNLAGITHLSEGGNDLAWFHKQVFGSAGRG